ncbi:hypothetical protein IOK_08719 [Yersinia enterocolitica subsp. palearctica PhRBD_Ye1]|nr:hypothetical protein IOK_08719 [Yersinia enterocolitica subsp. palearctica PhRBD_Ye1]
MTGIQDFKIASIELADRNDFDKDYLTKMADTD